MYQNLPSSLTYRSCIHMKISVHRDYKAPEWVFIKHFQKVEKYVKDIQSYTHIHIRHPHTDGLGTWPRLQASYISKSAQRQVECPTLYTGDNIPGPQTGEVQPRSSTQAFRGGPPYKPKCAHSMWLHQKTLYKVLYTRINCKCP